MSRRGRRRNSKRRKSSSSSKQSSALYILQKENKSNDVEKGQTDCLGKEYVLSGSEDEDKYNNEPPKEKRLKHDYNLSSFAHKSSIYTTTTEDKENGIKIVTSVSVDEMRDSSPQIIFQQSHEPLYENQPHVSLPVKKIMQINCTGSRMNLEISGIQQHNTAGIKTTVVFMNEKGDGALSFFNSECERTWLPNDDPPEEPSQGVTDQTSQNTTNDLTFGSICEQTVANCDSKSASLTDIRENPNYCQSCCDHTQPRPTDLMVTDPPSKKNPLCKSSSSDLFWDIPPPREFADNRYNTLDDLAHDLASCMIGSRSAADHPKTNIIFNEESGYPFSSEAKERVDLAPLFDQLSQSDNYEPMFMRPSFSTNRSSFTKRFINCHNNCWIRNNSIATVEHRPCVLLKKRCNTFPGVSGGPGWMQEDLFLPFSESFSSGVVSSLARCSLALQTERLGIPHSPNGKQSLLYNQFCKTFCEDPDDVFTVVDQRRRGSSITYHNNYFYPDDRDKVNQSEEADVGFDQEMGEVDYHSPERLIDEFNLAIQVIPPSCSGSEEHLLQSQPVSLIHNEELENASRWDSIPASPKKSKSSVITMTVGSLEHRFLQTDGGCVLGSCVEQQTASADAGTAAFQVIDELVLNTSEAAEETQPEAAADNDRHTRPSPTPTVEETNDLQWNAGRRGTVESDQPLLSSLSPAKASTSTEFHPKEHPSKTPDKQPVNRPGREHFKLTVFKEPDGSDSWAKRRKLFKDSKQWSSAGGSSITSDITEESAPEDSRSADTTLGDNEDKGFYTETFHSAAWIYQGDAAAPQAIPPSLNSRNRAISIRERTVKISKGTGEYPWGFRIQFSKPIVVTEVDTNGAAEEAGLMVGDYVLAVNGTDVTSIPHSEAADLARQGPDDLILTIGSDIARGPNTPRPACRGYLHKRTQSGLIKGWRKRWFVLKHDCCLYYYRHKQDERKRPALSAVKLEGAEVGPDLSLGKPFVLKCRPLAVSRLYYFCATSNQEMKRWLEAMEKAIHPVIQNHVWVDVTRHNSSLPPLAVKSPDCLGLLHKMDKNKEVWGQYYCILKDACLYLYCGIRATHAHGGIYLQGYAVREQPFGCKKSTIELHPPSDEFKTFYLCAENPNDNKRWIIAIKASINKWLPLHQALQDYMNRSPEETRM